MARRVPVEIFVDSESQQSASEECLLVCVDRKSVGPSRRRSSSLDTGNENRKHRNRKALAEKAHSDRMVCC